MGWVQLAVLIFQLTLKIWDAIHEKEDQVKKQKTEVLQSGVRGIIDKDPSRVVAAFDELRRLRGL